MNPANPEFFPKPSAISLACQGGLDLLSPAVSAPPGALQECWNYEVANETGYQLAEGIMNWAGKTLYAITEYMAGEITSEVGAVTSLQQGGEYRISNANGSLTGEIKVIDYILGGTNPQVWFQLISGDWVDPNTGNQIFDGPVRIYPDRNDTAVYHVMENAAIREYTDVTDFRSRMNSVNSVVSANGDFRPPGNGPITCIFELDDEIYAVRDLPDNSGGQLYKASSMKDATASPSWETVDMGYEIAFQDGRSKPFTLSDRRFLGLTPGDSVDKLNITGDTATSTLYSQGQENQIAWQTIENVLDSETGDETSSRGFVSLGSGVGVDEFRTTQALQITGFNIGEDQPASAEVVGIEVRARYEHLHTEEFPASDSDKKARFLSCRLLNVGSTANKADTTTRLASGSGTAGHGIRTEAMGGTTDTWTASELTRERLFSDDFGVELVFAHAKGSSLADFWYGAFTKVYWVEISVYFADATEKVYFRNLGTGADVAEAEISEFTLSDGSWASGTASGVFSLYNVISPASITDNLEIRTGANGTGIRIAATKGTAEQALLPTSAEMKENNSLAQTIKANFFIDAEREAIYGVTGAGPAFTYNGFYFHRIRTPIPIEKDKPRHVAEHEGHLVLAYNSGSILVSAVAQPTNFSGLAGASEFGFGDNIVGLSPLNGAALGVLCKQSTHALLGTTLENFSTQKISKSSGAIEYTIATVGQPFYADFRGISGIQATQQYGDFLAGRLSQRVTKFLRDRLQNSTKTALATEAPVAALPVRNKNQYRLFFRDGVIATMTLFGSGDELPVFTLQKYKLDGTDPTAPYTEFVPTAVLSSVLSNGIELLMIGTTSGDIYLLDQGTGIIRSNGIEAYDAFITFTPFNGGEPHTNLKYNEILIHGQTSGGQELVTSAGVNYLIPDPSTQTDEITMGSVNSEFYLKRVPQKKSTHLPNVTSGFSLKIESQADGNIPHIIQALTFRPTLVGDQSNGQKRYVGPVDTDI